MNREIAVFILLLVLTATTCGQASVPTPVSTFAPVVTSVPTSTSAPTDTTAIPSPTATTLPTATSAPSAMASMILPSPTVAPSATTLPSLTPTRIPPTRTGTPTATPTLPMGATCQQNPNAQITYVQVGQKRISEFQYLQTLSGHVYFYATADRPNLWYYKIESSTDRKGWTVLGRIVTGRSLNNELAVAWDTTLVPDGNYWLRMLVVDKSGGYYEPCEIPVVVHNVASKVTVVPVCQDANSELTAPQMDQVVTGPVNIYGSFHRDNLSVARLQYSPDQSNWTQLQQYNRALTNELLYIWKTNTLANGDYWIRILVIDKTGNYNDPCTVHIVVRN